MNAATKKELTELLEQNPGLVDSIPADAEIIKCTRVRGGCISKAFKLDFQGNSSLFVKIAKTSDTAMFEGEFGGLEAIRATQAIRAPRPLLCGSLASGGSFLLMEYIEFARSYSRSDTLAVLGERLAALHLAPPPSPCLGFGFPIDNTVGTTPQPNGWNTDWMRFFLEQRLQHQVELTRDAEIRCLAQRIYYNLPVLIGSAPSKPSLIHGDLWTGNFAVAADTLEPVLFDPACYWADSEAEFGISYMQGGLGKEFFDAYNRLNPPRDGWRIRREIYMLYHCLNHLNLWGSHWRDACISTMEKILNLLPQMHNT